MRTLLSIALLAAASMGAYAQSEKAKQPDETVIEGIDLSQTVPCDGRDIGIYGANNKIDLTGDCGNVVVHGDGHNVSVEKAASLAVSGAGHTVSAASISTLTIETTENTVNATIDGAPGSVTISGADQVANLTLAAATNIDLGGTVNTVNWSVISGAPEPRVNLGGIENAINRIE